MVRSAAEPPCDHRPPAPPPAVLDDRGVCGVVLAGRPENTRIYPPSRVIWQISDNYDRRKPARIAVWAILAWVVLLVCFFFMPPPNPHPRLTPVNINYVWGPSDYAAQSWVSPAVWHIGLMIGLPCCCSGRLIFCYCASPRSRNDNCSISLPSFILPPQPTPAARSPSCATPRAVYCALWGGSK